MPMKLTRIQLERKLTRIERKVASLERKNDELELELAAKADRAFALGVQYGEAISLKKRARRFETHGNTKWPKGWRASK